MGKHTKLGEGEHNRLGEGERKVRLGQDTLPNIAETSSEVAESSDVVLPTPLQQQESFITFWPSLFSEDFKVTFISRWCDNKKCQIESKIFKQFSGKVSDGRTP